MPDRPSRQSQPGSGEDEGAAGGAAEEERAVQAGVRAELMQRMFKLCCSLSCWGDDTKLVPHAVLALLSTAGFTTRGSCCHEFALLALLALLACT